MSTTENSLPSDDMPVTPNSEPLQTDPVLKVPPRHQASTGETPGTPEGSNEAPHSTISPRQARQRLNVPMPNMEVLAIDDALGIQTEIDKARDKFLDLVESLKTGRYLTDRIQGVEKHSGQGEPRAVIFHGDYKVIIMASMIVDLPKDLRGQDPMKSTITCLPSDSDLKSIMLSRALTAIPVWQSAAGRTPWLQSAGITT